MNGIQTSSAVRKKKLSVLVVTAAYPENGSRGGAFLEREVEGLRKEGIDVTVLHLKGKFKYLTGALKVFAASFSRKYDIIHGHYSFCGAVARFQFLKPVVISFWGTDLLTNPDLPDTKSRKISRAISPIIAKMADWNTTPIPYMTTLIPGARVRVVTQGIDFTAFYPIPQIEARKKLGLDLNLNHRYILFCSDPKRPVKGFPIAEAAAAKLRQEGMDVELLIVNNQPQEKLLLYYNDGDVIVVPSYWEAGPYVVKEAMACNLPVIATDVGDVREITKKTVGCAIAERTPEAFAAAIKRTLLAVRKTTGRQDIAHLTYRNFIEKVTLVYVDVMKRRKKITSIYDLDITRLEDDSNNFDITVKHRTV